MNPLKNRNGPLPSFTGMFTGYIDVNKCNETEKSVRGLEVYIKSKLKLEKTLVMKNNHNLLVICREVGQYDTLDRQLKSRQPKLKLRK